MAAMEEEPFLEDLEASRAKVEAPCLGRRRLKWAVAVTGPLLLLAVLLHWHVEPEAERVKASSNPLELFEQTALNTTCTSLLVSESVYLYASDQFETGAMFREDAKDATSELTSEDWILMGEYKHISPANFIFQSETDLANWWLKDGMCILSFEGSDSAYDFFNDYMFQTVSQWGLEAVHKGLVLELAPLIALMGTDFPKMRDLCSNMTVSGHSLGGGLAQLFTLVASHPEDHLEADLKIDRLVTFGAMPVTVDGAMASQSCLSGTLYFNGMRDDNTVYVEIVLAPEVGATGLKPIRMMDKVVLLSETQKIKIPCGEDLDGTHLLDGEVVTMKPYDGYDMHSPALYQSRIGCLRQPATEAVTATETATATTSNLATTSSIAIISSAITSNIATTSWTTTTMTTTSLNSPLATDRRRRRRRRRKRTAGGPSVAKGPHPTPNSPLATNSSL